LANDDLLRPTLSDYRQVPAIYSSTGFFLSTFFGGPVGAAFYGLCNSQRLNRLWTDLVLFVALAAAAFAMLVLLQRGGQMDAFAELIGTDRRRTFEISLRALALVCFAAIYFMHRKFFRTAQVSGVKPLSGWVPGLAAVILGYFANLGFIDWILKHH